jgi:hypothetical protein
MKDSIRPAVGSILDIGSGYPYGADRTSSGYGSITDLDAVATPYIPDPYPLPVDSVLPSWMMPGGPTSMGTDPTWAESGPLGYSSITGTFYPTAAEILAAETSSR